MPKINEVHKPLYTSTKRFVYEKGGRGGGKSFAVTDYALRLTYDTNRVILFMRYTMMSATISIIPEFESAMSSQECESDFKIVGSEILNIHTNSRIIFKGVKTSSLNQTANLKSIQGLTDVIYDEFEEHPDQESFDKLDESIRSITASNKIVLVSNALHKKSWQYLQFWDKNGLYYDMTDRITTTFEHNYHNLSESWHQKRLLVKKKNPEKYLITYLGIDYEDLEGALWNSKIIKHGTIPELKKICVAIDPAVTNNEDSDEHGIIVVGLGYDGKGYLVDDLSGEYTPNGMAQKVIYAYDKYQADIIIGEVNNGGDFIENSLRSIDNNVRYKSVRATRGKALRAEPVVGLYEQDKIIHNRGLEKLETEMTTWNPEKSNFSPNRIDAMVYGFTYLFLGKKTTLPPIIG